MGLGVPCQGRGGEWPSPFVLLDFHLCPPVREYEPITRSNRERRTSRWQRERQRPHGRGDRGGLWYVDGPDRPTLVVNRPPDANRGGDAEEPGTTGIGNAPEGDGVILPSCKPLALAMG